MPHVRLRLLLTGLVVGVAVDSGAEIDLEAREVLAATSAYLKQITHLAFTAEEVYEELDEAGRRRHFSNLRRVACRKPDRLVADVVGDTRNRTVWFDGERIALHDKRFNLYAVAAARATIDDTLDWLAETYDVALPLTELLYADPGEALTERVTRGAYLGVGHVGDIPCHHLYLRQEGLDWQLWVETGERPRPRRLVLTYPDEPGLPQFTATIESWNDRAVLDEALFRFEPPAGAEKVPLADTDDPRLSGAGGER